MTRLLAIATRSIAMSNRLTARFRWPTRPLRPCTSSDSLHPTTVDRAGYRTNAIEYVRKQHVMEQTCVQFSAIRG